MNPEEVFSIWAPQNSIWSRWVAPVLFAQTHWAGRIQAAPVAPQALSWLHPKPADTAFIIDLPGAESVEVGFALAGAGFRPVPLYNASPSPENFLDLGLGSSKASNAVIDMAPIINAICRITNSLQRLHFSPDAPPALLLDALRLSGAKPVERGMFDNRWMVFPQDFPSANFLLEHGIRQAILVQKDQLQPQDDLAHSLLRWQEGGIKVLSKKLNDDAAPSEITVKRPSKYKAAWYRSLAQLGLRRNSAGGFGSYIPEITAAG